jgi:hypothetical protein
VLFIGFGLCFAPGWANEWPGGLPIHRVWSCGTSGWLFVILVTAGVGFGTFVSFLMGFFSRVRRFADRFFGIWLVIWTVPSAVASVWAYREIDASALTTWPNGYSVGP